MHCTVIVIVAVFIKYAGRHSSSHTIILHYMKVKVDSTNPIWTARGLDMC